MRIMLQLLSVMLISVVAFARDYTIPLNQDWNLVSLPVKVELNQAELTTLFSPQEVQNVYAYLDSIGEWVFWDGGVQEVDALERFTELRNVSAFWVETNASTTLTLSVSDSLAAESEANCLSNVPILTEDWTLGGTYCPSITPSEFVTATNDRIENCQNQRQVKLMLAYRDDGNWSVYTPSDSYNNQISSSKPRISTIPNTMGFWIKSTASDCTLSVPDTTAPSVLYTFPQENSTGVAKDKDIRIALSEPIDSVTVSSSSVALNNGSIDIAGKVSLKNNIITFSPYGDLSKDTNYTVTVKSIIADTAGNLLSSDYSYEFRTEETPIITLSADNNVSSGAPITYTASLNAAPRRDLNITLSNGKTIGIPPGKSSGKTTTIAPSVDDCGGDVQVNVSVSAATGGGYEDVIDTTTKGSTSTTVAGNGGGTTVLTLDATKTALEGQSILYTANVNSAPESDLVITLNTGTKITIPGGQTTASASYTIPDDVYDSSDFTAAVATATGNVCGNLDTTDTAITNITDDGDITTITLNADNNVIEGNNITYTATVDHAPKSDLILTLSTGSKITIPKGQTSGFVTYPAPDNVYQGGGTLAVSVSDATGGNYENLNTSDTASTSITDDGDPTVISLTADSSVVEGGTITYTASVDHAPQSNLTITLSNGKTITIPAGSSSASTTGTAQTIGTCGASATETVTINSASGGNYENLNTSDSASTSVQNNLANYIVSLSAPATVNEGDIITYTAYTSSAVDNELILRLGLGMDITIPANQNTGSISMGTSDDYYIDGTWTTSITGTSGSACGTFDISNTTVSTTVLDDGDATSLQLSASPTSAAPGDTITYTATVGRSPRTTNLVVTLDTGDQITITPSQTSGSVTVSAPSSVCSNFSAYIASTSGGNFEAINNLNGGTNPVVTTNSAIPSGAPTVSAVYQGNSTTALNDGDTGIGPFIPSFRIHFSTVMDPSSLHTGTVTIGSKIRTVSMSNNNQDVILTPGTLPLYEETSYTLSVDAGVKDSCNNAMNSAYTLSFTTGKQSMVFKTGQTTEHTSGDDGTYKKGVIRRYTRDDINGTVVDNVTNLIWQDNVIVQKPWVTQANYDAGNYSDTSGDTATTYCDGLVLGGESDWRLPTFEELLALVDYAASSSPNIDNTFQYVGSDSPSPYWSANADGISTSYAVSVLFESGGSSADTKNNQWYIRCVRDGE